MKTNHSYAKGKLRETIFSLAIGPEDVRKRLAQAHQGFFALKNEHFPEKLQSDWEWIHNELTRFGPLRREDGSIFRGSVEHTCSKIKKKTGVKIAKRILDIYLSLEYD